VIEPKVAFVLGSDSDYPALEGALELLNRFAVPYEVVVASAHRSPERTRRYAVTLEERGIQVVIACAGGAAHLAGVLAAHTILPVIGVPIDSSPLQGLDALLSTAMMPAALLPGWLETVGKFNPVTYVINTARQFMNFGYAWMDLAKAFGIIAIVGLFTLTGATRAFKKATS